MREPLYSLALTVALAFLAVPLGAQPPVDRPGVERHVDALLNPLVEGGMVSGSVLISQGADIVLAKGYGLANREHGVANTPQTAFRIASISKSLTAIAIMQLVDRDLLALDTRLESLVPGFPNGEQITIEQLLSHSSGIPSDVYLEEFRDVSVRGLSLDESIEWVRDQEAQFSPGERFSYSNSGYLVLTAVIEAVAGMEYEEYLREEIFGPAEMARSGLDSATRILPGRASGYSRSEEGEIVRSAYREPSFGYGYGALFSTAVDLHRLARALVADRLMSQDAREQMFKARHETPWANRYGLGWFRDEWDGQDFVAALGGTAGFMGTLRYYPGRDTVLVVLLNQDFMLFEDLYDQLSAIALGRDWQPLFAQDASVIAELEDCAGVYEMEDGIKLSLEFDSTESFVVQEGVARRFQLVPMTRRTAYVPEQNGLFRFTESADDGAMELLAIYGNLAWRGRRIAEDDAAQIP